MDDVVAMAALPHAHINPTRDALAGSRRSVRTRERIAARGGSRQQRIRLSPHQYRLDAAGRPLVHRFNRTDGGPGGKIPFAVFDPPDGLSGSPSPTTIPRQ